MKKILVGIALLASYLTLVRPAFAATSEISTYTTNTLQILTVIAGIGAALFLIYGGYGYITSSGKPDALESAKRTIKNAVIGLVMVLSASVFISILSNALTSPTQSSSLSTITLAPIVTTTPSDGLVQVLIDASTGFMQNIVESSTKPIVDGILGYVTLTPSVLNNSVIVKFWLVSLGIVDSLFVLVVAILGLHVMSASTFGFEELNVKQLLPRIGLAFLGANISLFLTDYVIVTCNALVKTILDSTGGLNQAWIENALNLPALLSGNAKLITLIFLILFLILAVVLLLMYISRLILIALGAVLSPFIFLLWAIPKTASFAEIATKTYIVTVFTVFIHVVIIQLAASFLTLPVGSGNSLLSVAVAIGLFATLLKTPSLMMQLVSYTASTGFAQKLGNQMMNVLTTDKATAPDLNSSVKEPRKVANL